MYPALQGNASFVPGAPLRDDFAQYFFEHAHVKDFIAGVANASYAVPDLPSTWFTAQYIADRGLKYGRGRETRRDESDFSIHATHMQSVTVAISHFTHPLRQTRFGPTIGGFFH